MPRKLSFATMVFAVGLAVWILGGVLWWLHAPPLGHDESQYAIAFQDLLAGRPLRWVYLSRGMHAVAGPGVLLGGSELALRVVPLLCGVAFLLTSAQLAWRVFGATTAAWTVAVLASSTPLVRRSAELLSDLPAAALLLAGTSILVQELVRARAADQPSAAAPSWRLLWVAPLFAAAFYIRYGSCVPAALVGAACLVAGWRTTWRRPAPVLATGALLALLLVPHLLDSVALMGSPLAVLLESQSVPQSEVSGLRTYLTSNPIAFYGLALAPVLALGLCSLPAHVARLARVRRLAAPVHAGAAQAPSLRARRALVLWVIAVADVVAIGLTAVGQVRYILLAVVLLAMLGVELGRGWLAAVPWLRARRALTGALAVALAGAMVLSTLAVNRHGKTRRRALKSIFDTVAVMRRDAAGRRCHFVAGHYTQLEWYTGCNGHYFSIPQAHARGEPVYFVSDTSWQPSAEEAALPHVVLLEEALDRLQVVRLLPPGPAAPAAPARLPATAPPP